jgi:hypothetical protein
MSAASEFRGWSSASEDRAEAEAEAAKRGKTFPIIPFRLWRWQENRWVTLYGVLPGREVAGWRRLVAEGEVPG